MAAVLKSYRSILLVIAYIIACASNFLRWHFNDVESILRYAVAIPVVISIDWTKIDKFKIFLILFLIISLIARRLLVIWTLVAMSYQIIQLQIPIKKLAAIGAIVLGLEILFQIELWIFGLVEDTGYFAQKVRRMIYDFGTGNANSAGLLITFFLMVLYLAMKDKHLIPYLLFSLILAYFTYQVTSSRTSFISILILDALIIFWKAKLFMSWTRILVSVVPIVFFVGTFFLADNSEDYGDVNEAASGRIWYIVQFTENFTPREWLFGKARDDDFPLDSAYLDLLMKGGVVLASLFCSAFMIAVLRYFNRLKPYLPFALALLAGGVTETLFASPNAVAPFLWMIVISPFVNPKHEFTS